MKPLLGISWCGALFSSLLLSPLQRMEVVGVNAVCGFSQGSTPRLPDTPLGSHLGGPRADPPVLIPVRGRVAEERLEHNTR